MEDGDVLARGKRLPFSVGLRLQQFNSLSPLCFIFLLPFHPPSHPVRTLFLFVRVRAREGSGAYSRAIGKFLEALPRRSRCTVKEENQTVEFF